MSDYLISRVVHLGMTAALFTIFGCADKPPVIMPSPHMDSTTLIVEAKAETEGLRKELAAERILAAKQQAALEGAKKAASNFREREADLTQKFGAIQAEIMSLKTESDRLRKENSKLLAQVANLPQLLELVMEMRTAQSSMSEMVSSLKTLKGDFASFQKELHQFRAQIQNPGSPGTVSAHVSKGEANRKVQKKGVITIKQGDTLWDLGRHYNVSVRKLKEANNLTGHLIFPGQRLKIPDNHLAPQLHSSPSPDASIKNVIPKKIAPK